MPDLLDGQSVEIQGSAAKPYTLKNVGGVCSCSCPAWRNQSLPIDRRTCKHLRQYRGEAAEQARLGGTQSASFKQPTESKTAPPLLLAHGWNDEKDLTGWWMSEKLPFEDRRSVISSSVREDRCPYVRVLYQTLCEGIDHLQRELDRIESLGGEGLMLRQPESHYEAGRSHTLLKVKRFHDAEARVVQHLLGSGRGDGIPHPKHLQQNELPQAAR
jgi:hypothetical protein